jgi:type II secretory pathway component PulJ
MTEPGAISRSDGQSGATLIEIVVALAIVALTLAVAAGGLRLLARSGERGAQVIARHDILSRGVDVLRRDVERLERVVGKRGETTQFVFHGSATRLAFVAVEPPVPSEPGAYLIVYTIRQARDGDVLARERTPFQTSAVDLERLSAADSVSVIEGHYRLRFLYLDAREGRERWLAQWSDPYRLPDLVRLEVSGLAGAGGPVSIAFRPRIEAERSCVNEESRSCTIDTHGALGSDPASREDGK